MSAATLAEQACKAIESDAPPAQPSDEPSARVWLAWAAVYHHTDGCQCHGCIRARRLTAPTAGLDPATCPHEHVMPVDEHVGRCADCGEVGFPLTWEPEDFEAELGDCLAPVAPPPVHQGHASDPQRPFLRPPTPYTSET